MVSGEGQRLFDAAGDAAADHRLCADRLARRADGLDRREISWLDRLRAPAGRPVDRRPSRNALSRDAMLDTVSLYWFTASAASSARPYWHSIRRFVAGPNPVPPPCRLFTTEIMRLSRPGA